MAKGSYFRALRALAFGGSVVATLAMGVFWYRSLSRSDQCMILLPRSMLIIASARGRVIVLRVARQPSPGEARFSVVFGSEPLDDKGNAASLALVLYVFISQVNSTSVYRLGVGNVLQGHPNGFTLVGLSDYFVLAVVSLPLWVMLGRRLVLARRHRICGFPVVASPAPSRER